VAVLIPGVSLPAGTGQDVGGSLDNVRVGLTVHGSRRDSQRIMQNGLSLGTIVSDGSVSAAVTNMGAIAEVTIDYASISAEATQGGVRFNFIPREGGNTFRGNIFGSFMNSSMQGSNFSDELRARGLRTPDSIKKNWDINPGFGGPIRQDTLWFYTSIRHNGAQNYVAGMFYNKNANNPNLWTYEADTSRRASNETVWKDAQARLTWQATAKNKIGFTYNQQYQCQCLSTVSATLAPEAARYWYFPLQRMLHLDWNSPLTNKVLLEGAVFARGERFIMERPRDLNPLMIAVTEQSTGLQYRARTDYGNNWTANTYYRIAASYVTGSHAFKIGMNDGSGIVERYFFANQPVNYRFNNRVPNQVTLTAYPYLTELKMDHDLGIFAQDKWTFRRLTLTGGVRYDYFGNSFPEQHLGPAPLTPTREITFPESSNLALHDVSPRLGASYDLFGNGKTALKVTLNKYLAGLAANAGGVANPINTLVLQTNRAWSDANGNFAPDCDLLNPAANGECAAMANANFGRQVRGVSIDPDTLRGWGSRDYNWELSAGVQREIVPRVSVDLGYFRRSYGNFQVTDNRTVGPADFDRFSLTAPSDPRLPNGGGYTVSGLYDLNPAKFGQPADNYVTFAKHYGTQVERWNGVDVSVNARMDTGLLVQGGVSTGRTVTDNCEIVTQLPEILFSAPTLTLPNNNVWLPAQFCQQESPFLTQVKGYGAYTIPKIEVQLSGAFQSLPGPMILANFNAPNTVVSPSLRRNLSGNAANISVGLVEPGTMYGERLYQLDLRFAKILRFGRTRTSANLDVYNVFNANPVLGVNNSFAAWQRPTSILSARIAKISAQIDF
jgi:hypothetical protein